MTDTIGIKNRIIWVNKQENNYIQSQKHGQQNIGGYELQKLGIANK